MVLPSRLSSRGAADFFVTLGGKPIGLSTVIFSSLDSSASTADRSGAVVTLFMGSILQSVRICILEPTAAQVQLKYSWPLRCYAAGHEYRHGLNPSHGFVAGCDRPL